MADHIKIHKADGVWVVRAGGAVIGESANALELAEGSYTPVIYFPRSDLGMAFFDRSETTSHCPHKGDATYFDIVAKSGPIKDAAWSYEAPYEGVERIKDHIAFYTNKVAVEKV